MRATKEILSENRDSIISSIKWIFKVYRKEDIKSKMVDFLNWAENNAEEIQEADKARNTKTRLKSFISRMAREQQQARNLELFGTENPKLENLMAYESEKQIEKGNVWNPMLKTWVKNKSVNSKMAKAV